MAAGPAPAQAAPPPDMTVKQMAVNEKQVQGVNCGGSRRWMRSPNSAGGRQAGSQDHRALEGVAKKNGFASYDEYNNVLDNLGLVLAVALAYAAITHQLRGDVAQTEEYASRVTEICARHEFAYYDNWGLILAGWCRGGQAGADQIRRGLTRLRDQGSMARHPYYLSLLAETLISAGQADAAGAVLESARSAAAVHDDRWWLPELYRLDAKRSRGPARERLLRRAAELAQEQGAAALLRRATGGSRSAIARIRNGHERSRERLATYRPEQCRPDQRPGQPQEHS